MTVGAKLSPEKIAEYRATMQRRGKQAKVAQAQRRDEAWRVARRAATLLKDQFGATEVLLFGSLAHEHWFSPGSDIDLAAWGLASDDYFRAVAHLQDISPAFKIDLIDMARCPARLHAAITAEGVPL